MTQTELSAPHPRDYRRAITERDALQSIVADAQRREAEAERTIALLLAAGHLKEDKLEQARALARL